MLVADTHQHSDAFQRTYMVIARHELFNQLARSVRSTE
jgi:hypothetical protein